MTLSRRKKIKNFLLKSKTFSKFYGRYAAAREIFGTSRLGRIYLQPWTNVVQSEAEQVHIAAFAAARGLCATGDVRVIPPTALGRPPDCARLRIGFFGNTANNMYNVVRCMRHAGYDAELVIQTNNIDEHPLSRPYWEEVEIECSDFAAVAEHETRWQRPDWVHVVEYDMRLQEAYQNRFAAAFEVMGLYRETFSKPLAPDVALLLAQNMGHWAYVKAMGRYDVCVMSFAAIGMIPFSPVPAGAYPVGGDLFLAPFQEDSLLGLQMRAGYRRAAVVFAAGAYWREYFERLEVAHKTHRCAFLMDTELYAPGDAEDIRAAWHKAVGGTIFVLSICRQSWQWKGNDRLIRAFARLDHPDLRLVLTRWGDDIARSEALIAELGIAGRVHWLPIGSKRTVIRRAQAADAVADQFCMSSFGTSVMEAMATATPVILKFDPPPEGSDAPPTPPFFRAETEPEIEDALRRLTDPATRAKAGADCRDWILAHRGWQSQVERFANAVRTMQ